MRSESSNQASNQVQILTHVIPAHSSLMSRESCRLVSGNGLQHVVDWTNAWQYDAKKSGFNFHLAVVTWMVTVGSRLTFGGWRNGAQ